MSLHAITRLVLLEASKVRGYHTTLMEGIVRAYTVGGLTDSYGRLRLQAHPSFFGELSADVRNAVDFEPIPVVDQDHRRLATKSLVEVWVVVRSLFRLRSSDVLLVTTIMPSAMLVVEVLKWFIPHKRLVVMVHGELEAAFASRRGGVRSFTWYITSWLRIRRLRSDVEVVVPDFFIEREVRGALSASIRPHHLYVVPLPVVAIEGNVTRDWDGYRVCFAGFRTANKRFDIFQSVAAQVPQLEFRAIGAGVDQDLATGEKTALSSLHAYLSAVRRCDFALFPYTSGYRCTLSSAALDAVSSGLHIIAFSRPCFVALWEAFGPEAVTICDDEAGVLRLLRDADWLAAKVASRAERLERIASSPYGPQNVAAALEKMMVGASHCGRWHFGAAEK